MTENDGRAAGSATFAEDYLDSDLQDFPAVWAAGGTPNAVFRIAPADLTRLTQGRVADVARR